MSDEEAPAAVTWCRMDALGKVEARFEGTFSDLRAHLLRDLPEGRVPPPTIGPMYVRSLVARVVGPVVELTTPWGSQRWIPEPGPQRKPRRGAWLTRS